MRVVVSEFMSLDGVVQAPGGATEDTEGGFQHGGWFFDYFDPEVIGGVVDGYADANEVLLQGRRTYQVSSDAWPQRSGDPFTEWINSAQKYVVSNTLTEADVQRWQPTTIVPGAELVDKVAELRARPGGDVYIYGSLSVVRTLLAQGMVDELVLFISPTTLGGGKTLFPADRVRRNYELTSVQTSPKGVIVCRYRPTSG